MGENEPQFSSWFVLLTHLMGLSYPFSCSSLPDSSLSDLEPPTSLLKGEGRVGFDSVRPRLLGALEIGPTSLKRGEGPPSGSSRVVESE